DMTTSRGSAVSEKAGPLRNLTCSTRGTLSAAERTASLCPGVGQEKRVVAVNKRAYRGGDVVLFSRGIGPRHCCAAAGKEHLHGSRLPLSPDATTDATRAPDTRGVSCLTPRLLGRHTRLGLPRVSRVTEARAAVVGTAAEAP